MNWNGKQVEGIWGSVKQPVFLIEKEAPYHQLYANPAAVELGKKCGWESGTEYRLMDLLKDGEAKAFLRKLEQPDEIHIPVFCHLGKTVYSAVLFDWEGILVCLLHDVSPYYNDTQKALEEAQLANQAKTNFLSAISHDIRTPMNAIVGMTSIALMQEEIPDKIRDCLNKIQVASGHMMSLLNDVLDMSRIESGKMLLQKSDVDMADLLHEILIVVKPQAVAKGLNFNVELGKMEREHLWIDSMRVCQICNNLISNAVKFTPAGGRVSLFLEVTCQEGAQKELNAAQREENPGNCLLKIQVEDTGIGMSKEFLPRIFQAFERERTMTVSKIQGTGLGMAITHNLVKMMDGHISVESEVGKGSRFCVELPVRAAEDKRDLHNKALKGRRILLLVDDRALGQSIMEMLGELDMQADWVTNAMETVGAINQAAFLGKEYFALLTDERIDGVEMVDFLPQFKNRLGNQFPILMLSEEDWEQTEYVLTKAGVDAFIPLPLFRSRLSAGLYAFTEESKKESSRQDLNVEWNFSAIRVLLVEDNELNREIAQEILDMTGACVETAENGLEAVNRFRESDLSYYDIILMDIQMPVMDGLDAARKIRELDRPDAASVPIVAMTANAFLEDVRNSLEAGMNAHISKPLDIGQVYECMNRLLGRSGA